MNKEAKLVTITLTTRVVVNVGATDEEVLATAKSNFINKIDNDELFDNLDSIDSDLECPIGTLESDLK